MIKAGFFFFSFLCSLKQSALETAKAYQQYENQLPDLIAAGDDGAIRYLFNRLFSKARFYAFKITGSNEEAEDIVMKALAGVWERQKKYESLDHIERSVFLTIHNACVNYLEHKQVVDNYKTNHRHQPEYMAGELTDHLLIRAELTRHLHQEIEQLPKKTREVIKLQLYQGLPNRDIATQLGMDESTVRSHRARAIELLRSALLRKQLYHLVWMLYLFEKNF